MVYDCGRVYTPLALLIFSSFHRLNEAIQGDNSLTRNDYGFLAVLRHDFACR